MSTAAMRGVRSMRVAVVNVPIKVGPAAWRESFDRADVLSRDGAFGVNETLSPKQRELYRELAKKRNLGWFGLRTGNAVFWDKARWKRIRGEVVTLHARGESALARRYPGYNAARTATVVVLEDRETGDQVTIICTHWAPQGKKVPAAWGAWARREAKRQIRAVMAGHQASGRVVFLIGDLNVKAVVRMGLTGFRWLRRYGVDKIGVAVPAGTRFVSGSAKVFKAPTDHKHGVWSVVSWKRRIVD